MIAAFEGDGSRGAEHLAFRRQERSPVEDHRQATVRTIEFAHVVGGDHGVGRGVRRQPAPGAHMPRGLVARDVAVFAEQAHVHAEPDIAAATPASRAHEYELTLRQQLIQCRYGPSDSNQIRTTRQLRILFGINIYNVGNAGNRSIGDKAFGGKKNSIFRYVPRNGGGLGLSPVALGTALQEVEVRSIMRKFQIDGRAEFGLKRF